MASSRSAMLQLNRRRRHEILSNPEFVASAQSASIARGFVKGGGRICHASRSCCFCAALRPRLPLSGRATQISPGTTRFFPSMCLLHLPCMIRAAIGLQPYPHAEPPMQFLFVRPEVCPLELPAPQSGFLQIPAHTDTLAFGCILPAAGRIPVFHRLETYAAGCTAIKNSPGFAPGEFC